MSGKDDKMSCQDDMGLVSVLSAVFSAGARDKLVSDLE